MAGGDGAEEWQHRVFDTVYSNSNTHSDHNISDSMNSLAPILTRIEQQEVQGGRMKAKQLGVLHEDPAIDMRAMAKNFTLPSLALAIRDREDVLQQAALLAEAGDWHALQETVETYHPKHVLEMRRESHSRNQSFRSKVGAEQLRLDEHELERIRKRLMRMPRSISQGHGAKRAAVVIPLCLVNGVPSLLLEKRAQGLDRHPNEICLPGGMVCASSDPTIVAASLREMKNEIGGLELPNKHGDSSNDDNNNHSSIQVLGVLRLNWGQVHHLVGVAVTPVVCFLGELPEELHPNPASVANVFTIPTASLLDESLWLHRDGLAPIFLGGPEEIWGLTGYILYRFGQDILQPGSI